MQRKFINPVIMSRAPLNGYYRYKDVFQLVPAPPEAPRPPWEIGHYPLILEIAYNPQVYPERSEENDLWHADVYERKRCTRMSNQIRNKNEKVDKAWKKNTDQTIRERNRSAAIVQEQIVLLNSFTNHHFFQYKYKNNWYVPMGENQSVPKEPIWGQVCYFYDSSPTTIIDFSSTSCEAVDLIPIKEHYRYPRDGVVSDIKRQMTLPEDIGGLTAVQNNPELA